MNEPVETGEIRMKRFEPKLDAEVADNPLCEKCPNSESRRLSEFQITN